VPGIPFPELSGGISEEALLEVNLLKTSYRRSTLMLALHILKFF